MGAAAIVGGIIGLMSLAGTGTGMYLNHKAQGKAEARIKRAEKKSMLNAKKAGVSAIMNAMTAAATNSSEVRIRTLAAKDTLQQIEKVGFEGNYVIAKKLAKKVAEERTSHNYGKPDVNDNKVT